MLGITRAARRAGRGLSASHAPLRRSVHSASQILRDAEQATGVQWAGYINGQWTAATSGATFPVYDPASRERLIDLPAMGAEETRAAIDAAQTAFATWQTTTARDRATVLHEWHRLLMANADVLARLMTLECGKPLAEARGEVAYGASFLRWFAEEASRTYGRVIPATMPGRRLMTQLQPVGVCGLITPWNFPNAMITRKVAPALAAGCTAVIKPAAETPLSALALAALGAQAGVPAGVCNIVLAPAAGAHHVGTALTTHPSVRKISFTGSTAVGKQLLAQAAQTVKRVSMELGGNAPLIVFASADLDQAVKGIMASKFRNSGQTCVCVNRIYVEASVLDALVAKLSAAVAAMRVGHGLAEGVTAGPLISAAGLEKVARHVDDAVAHGATVVTGGRPLPEHGPHFYAPTVLTGAADTMAVAREETFGPVAALFAFTSEAEAVRRANDTTCGLASYLFSQDVSQIARVTRALAYGMVGVNDGLISTEVAPFGGMKESGLGREGAAEGILEYMETKYIMLGGIDETAPTSA